MATIPQQVAALATRIGTEFKTLRAEVLAVTGLKANLTTTAKGDLVSAINEVKASATGSPPDATTTAKGIVELATDAETTTGTDTVRAITPSNLAASWTARIATSVALGASDILVPSQNAVKTYVDARNDASDALVYKGAIDASTNPNYPAASAGHTYRISVAGKIGGASGAVVEVGDRITANVDGLSAGTQAAVGASWDITQNNIDGAVIGPASSTAGNLPIFSGTTGKVIADSGFSVSTGAIDTSAVIVPTRSAVKTYVDAGVGTAALKANNLSDLANVATARTNLGLGTAATQNTTAFDAAGAATAAQAASQPLDSDLTAIAALTSAADKVPYSTGASAWALATFTAAGRSLVAGVDAAAQRTTLSVYSQAEIGDPNTDYVATFNAALL